MLVCIIFCFKQKTAYEMRISDWSSEVCSSDLFIELVANYFEIRNVRVLNRAVGLFDLPTLPHSDFMLHLNVLHHAGHDFDTKHISDISSFQNYSRRYLASLRRITDAMLFQIGSNWGKIGSATCREKVVQ